MKKLLYPFCFIFIFSCSNAQEKKDSTTVKSKKIETSTNQIDTSSCEFSFVPVGNYKQTKSRILALRQNLYKEYKSLNSTTKKNKFLDSISNVFTSSLVNKIIPHWYGTEWDFNGISQTPGKGEIACGYFVSTTLKHLGMNLNRYKLAQQASMNIVKSIGIVPSNISKTSGKKVNDYLSKMKPGLYTVGLDNHVGFVFKNSKNQTFFIHSNYVEDKVMAEKTSISPAFESNIYYFSAITGNKTLMKKWLENTSLIIVK